MKEDDKNKESPYFQYWKRSKKLSVNNFEWIKDTFQFNRDFIKNYNEKSGEGYFLVYC